MIFLSYYILRVFDRDNHPAIGKKNNQISVCPLLVLKAV